MRRFSEMWTCDGLKNLTEIGISKCHVIAFFVADLKKRYHFYVPGLRARTIWKRLQFDEKEISFEFIALFYSPMRWAKKSAGNSKLLLFSSKRSCSYIVIALGDRVGLIAKLTLHFWLVEGQNLQFHKFQNLSARATLRDNLQLRH